MAVLIDKKRVLMGVRNQGRRYFPADPIVKTSPSNAGSMGSIYPQEKERYTHVDAEFKRIARRDKKTFLSDQCEEIKENNRDLFKKIKDVKEYFMQRQAQ